MQLVHDQILGTVYYLDGSDLDAQIDFGDWATVMISADYRQYTIMAQRCLVRFPRLARASRAACNYLLEANGLRRRWESEECGDYVRPAG
jgi:hypothetical protein